jgi:20S proteasome alpha/beta subunit
MEGVIFYTKPHNTLLHIRIASFWKPILEIARSKRKNIYTSMIVEVRCRYFACFRYYTDPSGTFWQCNAKAIGSGSEGADSSLQEQFNKVIKQD